MACVPHEATRAVDHARCVSICFGLLAGHANDGGIEENLLCFAPSLLILRYYYYSPWDGNSYILTIDLY
jgi:hypothetical protein